MMNKVFLMGRLVADPVLRQTATGTTVCDARIACDCDSKERDGTRKADFFTVVAFNGTAEFLSKYFTKGRMIVVVGRNRLHEYTDKDGNKRSTVEIMAESLYFADSKREDPKPQASAPYYAGAGAFTDDDAPPALPY